MGEAFRINYNYEVLKPAVTSIAHSSFAAACSAEAYNAKYAITGSFLEIREKGIITFHLVDADSSKTVFADRATILSYDDLDVLAERIAQACVERIPFSQTLAPAKVTTAEIPSPLRLRRPLATFLLNTGYLYAARGPTIDLYNLNFGLFFDLPRYSILPQMGIMRGKKMRSLT